ncbi:MAG: SLC13 family permease [Oscillospiraceae bacterium]
MCGLLWERFCGWVSGGWQCPYLRRSRRFCRSSSMRSLPSPTCRALRTAIRRSWCSWLAGADIITMVWEITGVDKRIAAHSLALVGTSVRQQVVIWFLISTVLSAVLPNTVVAAVLCSIAMAMLKFVGEGDVGKAAPRSSCSWRSSGAPITAACSRRSAAL